MRWLRRLLDGRLGTPEDLSDREGLLSQGWRYLGPLRGPHPTQPGVELEFSQYMRNNRGRLELLAVQETE